MNPPMIIAKSTIAPLDKPITRPWLLLTLAAMYPPMNTEIASIASMMYSRYSYGKSELISKTTDVMHIKTDIIITDDITPNIKAFKKALLSGVTFEKLRKKITSDT